MAKPAVHMGKRAGRKAEATAEGRLRNLFTGLVEEQVSSMTVAEAREKKQQVDKLIDEALASAPKRRGRR